MSEGRTAGSTYERLILIGRGGMGEVFLGRQRGLEGFERAVALKRVLPRYGEDPALRRMFVAEAQNMAGLNHPNICQTIELCALESDLFLVLELLEGVSLGALMERVGPLPSAVLGGILIQACAGLDHAHGRGLIHRDLSPGNLFVTTAGMIKILDFGIAKVAGTDTTSSGLKGKSPYMSPEHVKGKPVDARSDLFALGVIGIEALAGNPLFLRDSDYLTYQAILEDTRPVGLTTSPIDPLLATCLEVDPAGRPQSARALAREIRSTLHPHGGESSQPDLADYLEHHMAAELAESRQRVAEALAATVDPSPVVLRTLELRVAGPAVAPARAPAPAGGHRRLAVLAIAILFLAGAIGLVAHLGGDPPDEEVARAADPDASLAPAPPAASPPPPADAAPALPAAPVPDASPPVPAPGRKKRTGFVSIDAAPFATIRIDGKEVGTTPLLKHELVEGNHDVVAVTKDGRRKRLRLRVRPGRLSVERIRFD